MTRMILFLLLSASVWAESTEVLPLGKVIPRVECAANASQTYALYLPSSYRRGVNAPVVFIFEPLARGPLPVGFMQQAAEKYGYILAASNNSHNGPIAASLEAGDAMFHDVVTRFSIDPKRLYFAGFSGGARLAISIAAACRGCAAGVAASGAGFPQHLEPKDIKNLPIFSSVGREDFNFPEILVLEPKLKEVKSVYHIRRFDGAHEWAPADVWLEAFAWFNLQAMKSGALQKDNQIIGDGYRQALAAAADLAAQHQDFESLRAYRQAAADYDGLADTSEALRRASELEKSKVAKDGANREHHQADQQSAMAAPIYRDIQTLVSDPSFRAATLRELKDLFEGVRRRANNERDSQHMVAKRVLTGEFIHIYETGAALLDAKDYRTALILYDVIVTNAKKAPGAHLQRARAYAALNDSKQAMNELQAAIVDGLNDSADLNQPEFAFLRTTPEFKAVVESLTMTK